MSAESTDCWPWTSRVDRYGYGQINVGGRGGRKVLAHRLAYELSTGEPIPAGVQVDHICHVRRCCNPQHLRLVTQKQNHENRRGSPKGSRSGIRGVDRHHSGRWRAAVKHNGKSIHVGLFDTAEEAGEAARLKRLELFTHNDADRRRFTEGRNGESSNTE